MENKMLALLGGFGVVAGLVYSLYMVFLRVPSVLDIRPELAEVGIVSGFFGGRPWSYLYYHYPVGMTIVTCVGVVLVLIVPMYIE